MSAGTENLVAKFHRKILSGCLKIEKCIRGLLFATPCTTFIYIRLHILNTHFLWPFCEILRANVHVQDNY